MECPKCGFKSVKDGHIRGKQRYKCSHCNYQFTNNNKIEISTDIKVLAMYLYLNGMPISEIAKFFQISTTSVYKYIYKLNEMFRCTKRNKNVCFYYHADFTRSRIPKNRKVEIKMNDNYAPYDILCF